ncbi:MAG: PAS domain-containing protein [Deltaproteobacteria bacterium]|nr:PAS domain-containing protein [Deltaproteobacteria bacterium]
MFDMTNTFQNTARAKFRPLLWIMAGCIIILLPIFIFWTSDNINRQKRAIERLLTDKAESIIQSFEGATRFAMMASIESRLPVPDTFNQLRDQNPLQGLVTFFTQNQDISYIVLTDLEGNITNHNDPDQIGESYRKETDFKELVETKVLRKREVTAREGKKVFEVYRVFLPEMTVQGPFNRQGGGHLQRSRRNLFRANPYYPEEESRIIYIGLDMSHIEAQSREDTRELIKKGFYLLLIGFAGISLLILVQAYRSARTSLSRIKALSDNIVENMPIGLIVLDTDLKIASFNHIAETLLHMSGQEMLGKPVAEKLPDELIRLIDGLRLKEKNIVKELEIDLAENRKVYLDLNVSILKDSSGTLLGYIILFRDLSEVKELKKEVERSTRLASIGRLAAGVAHEIRNPLSSIKGFATYFGERYKDVPEDRNTAQIMVSEVERLNRVITQLLDFARPVDAKREILDIKKVINHSIKMIERDANEHNIRVKVDIAPGIPHISFDTDLMNQVFLNLFLNSVEAMENGGELSVRAGYDPDTENVRIAVSDTGKGIDPSYITSIFDPYFTTKQSGTGLGLAIVHRIIESHNGEIKVESNPDAGTEVIITLPLD